MVDLLGHVAMGLLWAAPAWFLRDVRTTLAFVGLVLLFVMVPDVDLYLPWVVHHGLTHTVLFVATVALAVGGLVTTALTAAERRRSDTPSESWGRVYRFVTCGLLVGGLSHLFIDMLSAGTGGNPPLEPFWPLSLQPFSVDFIYYSSFAWNAGLLGAALLVHVVLFALEASDREGFSRTEHE